MKTLAKGLSLLLLLLVCVSVTFAQVQVMTRPLTNTLEVFFLKDFDINSPASSRPIFFIDLINDSQAREVILVSIVQSREHGQLSRGETIPFSLMASERLTISSSQLFSNSGPYRFNNFSIAEDVVDELLENILATGRLPTGIYSFETIVKDVNRTTLDDDSFEIRISNPTTLDLIGPGSRASGRIDDCAIVFSNLPQFRWASNMSRFRVIVAEWKPGEDPESALNQEPRFTRIFLLQNSRSINLIEIGKDLGFNDRVEVIPTTSFTYPSSGESLVLRPGKTYVWRVIGLVSTSSGPTSIANEIYCFRIPRLDELGNYMQQFESILRPLLGSDYEKLFGSGGEFSGYKPKRILLDGKEVTLIEILTKLQKLTSKYQGYTIE
ncbi:hypothetical protein IH879_16370 [candidate division KSB1 bacterium]|nr:hypothetical protein [candidate division KSB1 bacterium]